MSMDVKPTQPVREMPADQEADLSRKRLLERLIQAEAHISRMQPLFKTMRERIGHVELSRFWKLRNVYFRLKKRLGLDADGALPSFRLPLDIAEYARTDDTYFLWLQQNELRRSDADRLRDAAAVFAYQPTISVLVPARGASDSDLRATIESVCAQVYVRWELCIVVRAGDLARAQSIVASCEPYAGSIEVLETGEMELAAQLNAGLRATLGEFITTVAPGDVLTPDALFENARMLNGERDADLIYSDEDRIDDEGRRTRPRFKHGWAPESYLSRNYIGDLALIRRSLVRALEGYRANFGSSTGYDLGLRVVEKTMAIRHIPRVLYSRRGRSRSPSGEPDRTRDAIAAALVRRGEPGRVHAVADAPGSYNVRYDLRRPWRVSIVVPTRDHADDLERCLASIFGRSTYRNFEVIVVDNKSVERATATTLASWLAREPKRVRVLRYEIPFNYSKLNNYAVGFATGDMVLLLNNDTEVIAADWLEALLEQAQRPGIGCVGAKLLYADDTIQHAGVVMGLGGVAGHSHRYFDRDALGYGHAIQTVTNYSAVTAACLMVRREIWERLGGLNEKLEVAYNDVDFCLRVREAGFRNVYVPHAELYHFESKSRGIDDTPKKIARNIKEREYMKTHWDLTTTDPYYNPHLTLVTEDFAIRV